MARHTRPKGVRYLALPGRKMAGFQKTYIRVPRSCVLCGADKASGFLMWKPAEFDWKERVCFDCMGKRGISAPTQEQLNADPIGKVPR